MATDTTRTLTTGDTSLGTSGNTAQQFSGQDLGDPSGSASRNLTSYASGLDPAGNEKSIMDDYNAAKTAVQNRGLATGQGIKDTAGSNIEQAKMENAAKMTGTQESQRGFAVNTALINNLQATGDKRIRDLTRDMSTALANNDASTASSLASLVVQEHQTVTQARQLYVDTLTKAADESRASSAEARAQAGFQTPQQAADMAYQNTLRNNVASLATTAPGAGILPTDDLATAIKKYKQSPEYQRDVKAAEGNIAKLTADTASARAQATAAIASASASSATAEQTRTLTKLYGVTPSADGTDPLSIAIKEGRLSAATPGLSDPLTRANYLRVLATDPKHDFNKDALTLQGQQAATTASNSGNALSALTVGAQRSLGTGLDILGGSSGSTPSTALPFTSNGIDLSKFHQ